MTVYVRGNTGFPKTNPWKTMNLEELEQTKQQGANRNTTSLFDSNVVCPEGSFNAILPVQKTSKTSASFVTPIVESQRNLGNDENFHVIAANQLWKERTAGSLSIDKNWR